MKWTQVFAGKFHRANDNLWTAIGDRGGQVIETLCKQPRFAQVCADAITEALGRFDNHEPRIHTFARAREILGDDLIIPYEISQCTGFEYPPALMQMLHETLPSDDVLMQLKSDGMMLVAGPPYRRTLIEIYKIFRRHFRAKDNDGWYLRSNQAFVYTDATEPGWIALRKEPVANSLDKCWNKQNALVTYPMTVPNVAEASWGVTMYKVVRDVYLLSNLYVRTSSLDSGGGPVIIGLFDDGGLVVDHNSDANHYTHLGISAARKF